MDAPCGHRVNVFQLSDTPKGRSKCCAVGGVALPLVKGKMNKWIGVSMALDVAQSCASWVFLEITLDVLPVVDVSLETCKTTDPS